MINKILCFLFGHKWSFIFVTETRENVCNRCHKVRILKRSKPNEETNFNFDVFKNT